MLCGDVCWSFTAGRRQLWTKATDFEDAEEVPPSPKESARHRPWGEVWGVGRAPGEQAVLLVLTWVELLILSGRCVCGPVGARFTGGDHFASCVNV